jgi:hypothetical protein
MKPFNLEKARNGAQVVHMDGDRARDWHYFEGAEYPVHIQWKSGEVGRYKVTDTYIGIAPNKTVEYVAFDKDGFYAGRDTLSRAVYNCPDAIAYFKISADEDGEGWSMEKVK